MSSQTVLNLRMFTETFCIHHGDGFQLQISSKQNISETRLSRRCYSCEVSVFLRAPKVTFTQCFWHGAGAAHMPVCIQCETSSDVMHFFKQPPSRCCQEILHYMEEWKPVVSFPHCTAHGQTQDTHAHTQPSARNHLQVCWSFILKN